MEVNFAEAFNDKRLVWKWCFYLPGTEVHLLRVEVSQCCTSFAQLSLIAQSARGATLQFANELQGPGLSAVEQNTTNSAEDSLQVSRAPLPD